MFGRQKFRFQSHVTWYDTSQIKQVKLLPKVIDATRIIQNRDILVDLYIDILSIGERDARLPHHDHVKIVFYRGFIFMPKGLS